MFPARNEAASLEGVVRGGLAHTQPEARDVLLADDESDVGTGAHVEGVGVAHAEVCGGAPAARR